MPMVDYRAARDGVTLEEVMAYLRLLRPWGTQAQRYGPCPFGCCDPFEAGIPKGKRRARLRCCGYNFERKVWRCCRCARGGNHLDLVVQLRQVEVFEAVHLVYNHLNRQVPYLKTFDERQRELGKGSS